MLPHCLQFSPCSFPAVHLGAIRHFDDKLIDILTQLVLSSCRDPIKLEHEHDPPIHLGFCQSFGNHRVRSLEWSCENRYDLMGTREWCAAGHWDMAGYAYHPSDTTVGQHLTKCWLTGSDGLFRKSFQQNLPSWRPEHIEIIELCLCRASKTGHGGRYLAIIRAVCPVSVKAMISLPRSVDGWCYMLDEHRLTAIQKCIVAYHCSILELWYCHVRELVYVILRFWFSLYWNYLYLMHFNGMPLDKNNATGAQSASMTVFTAEEQMDSTSMNWRLEKISENVMLGHCSCWYHWEKDWAHEVGFQRCNSDLQIQGLRCQDMHSASLCQAKVFLVGLRQKQGSTSTRQYLAL